MKHRKKWFLVFLLAGIILIMVPFSIAYLTHVETRENRITIGQNDVMIEEDFTPPKQWQPDTTYEKDVKVRNTGSVPCYVRVYTALSDHTCLLYTSVAMVGHPDDVPPDVHPAQSLHDVIESDYR